MIACQSKRARQRAQSFTNCLLAVVVFFGGIGYYYFNVFRWRHLEDPMMDRTIVEIKERDSAVLYPFRKRTVADIIDPTSGELARIKDFRKSTKKGKNIPEDWDQETTEVLNRLLEIMEQAKLRRIPKRYSKDYDEVLWGIHHTYLSIRAFRAYCDTSPEQTDVRKVKYKECYDQYKKATRKLRKARDYFHDNSASGGA